MQGASSAPAPDRALLNAIAFECGTEGTRQACDSQLQLLKDYLEATKPDE